MPLAEFHDAFPDLCRRLLTSRRAGRLGQSYLLVGDNPGLLGRLATAWGQVCACTQPRPDGDACGQCDNCTRLANGTYPERIDLTPESKSRSIVVERMREFETRLNLTAQASRPKIGIVAEAECMGIEAQNAFLKTLEEPPPHTVLMLFTTQPRRLLATIRSRCQTIAALQNHNDYDDLRQYGLFALLAHLRRQQGAAVGLAISSRLQAVFATLQDQAQEAVGGDADPRWAELAESDKRLVKVIEERQTNRVTADYVRRRRLVEDAIAAWFLQERLRAAGVSPALLPHPEFYADLPDDLRHLAPPEPDEADENLRLVNDLTRSLGAYVPEALALDAFCLAVTEKAPPPQPPRR